MDYTVHGILQATILEWIAVPFSMGIFPTLGSNPGLPHCRQILYQLNHQENPRILNWVAYPLCSGSSWPRNLTGVSCIAVGFFISWATMEAPDTHSCTLQIEDRPAPETALTSLVFSLFSSLLVRFFLPSLFSFPGFFQEVDDFGVLMDWDFSCMNISWITKYLRGLWTMAVTKGLSLEARWW